MEVFIMNQAENIKTLKENEQQAKQLNEVLKMVNEAVKKEMPTGSRMDVWGISGTSPGNQPRTVLVKKFRYLKINSTDRLQAMSAVRSIFFHPDLFPQRSISRAIP